MSFVAILGAGPIGAATAQSLARRGIVSEICLIDDAREAAAGIALDIQQSGTLEPFETRLSGKSDVLAAAGAAVIVVADPRGQADWPADAGLNLVDRLIRAGAAAPIVFAGPSQTPLMEACARDLKLPSHRLLGSAASAVVSGIRALAGLELGLSAIDVAVVGRPPEFVVAWSAATVCGSLVIDRVPAHRLLAIGQSVRRLWPPGPYSIGAATAEAVHALIFGSRRLHPAATILHGELGARGAAVLLPLELGRLRVLRHVVPSLSPQERTAVTNGLRQFGG